MPESRNKSLISLSMLKTLWDKGFYHIFGSAFINKIIQFCASILLVRILSKELYGVWTYAENILQIFLLLQGLGCAVGLLQYSSATNKPEEKFKYLKFSLIVGICSNFMVALGILIFTIFGSLAIHGSKQILFYLCLFPLVSVIFDIIQIYFRSAFENKKFAFLTTVNSATFLLFSTLGAYFWGIIGVAAGRYIAVIMSVILGLYYLKPYFKDIISAPALLHSEKKEFMSYSLLSMLSSIFSSLLFLLDVFFIGLIMKDSLLVASYKIATIIPFAMNFLPMTIIIYMYPYLVQAAQDKRKIKEKVRMLVKYLALINASITIICILFANLIIRIIFGTKFIDAVPYFRILMLSYFVIGTFRSPFGNTISALKKVKFNLIVVSITGVLNVVMDYFLIKRYGMYGAAYTSLSIAIISSAMVYVFLHKYLKQ